MKKILLAVTAALAITGCSQNEEFEAPSQKAEINFNTAVTRATELDTDGLENSGFQVYAYNTKAEEMSATVTLSTPWINGSATYSDSKWTVSGGPYYWPLAENLQFFAYSPKDGVTYTAPNGTTDKGYPKFTYTVGNTAALQKDLVIASVANAQKKTNEAATDVSLTFKHALTQVNIEVTKEAGYTYTISKVELTGIKGSGTFTYAGVNAGTWTAGTETSVSYAYELGAFSDDKTAVKAGNALMLIPQALTDAKISIEYTVEKDGSKIAENSKEVSLTSTAAWAFGKKILYKLTLPIGAQEVGITATVTGWDAEDPVTPTVD